MKRLVVVIAGIALVAVACAQPRVDHPASQTGETLPDVAHVVCDASGTRVLTPVVQPQPDGVHVSIDNQTGKDLGIEFQGLGGDNAPAGVSEVVWAIPPGVASLRCSDPQQDAGAPASFVPLSVQDPSGLWVDDGVDCGTAGTVAGTADYAPGATGDTGDPVDLAKQRLATRLQDGDRVIRGGYPQTPDAEVVVIRDEKVVASLRYISDEPGTGWLFSEQTNCQDF